MNRQKPAQKPGTRPTPGAKKNRRRAGLRAAIAFCLALPLLAASPTARIHQHTLQNGLKVIIAESHDAPSATFQIYYRTGSRNDPPHKSGISHYLEHMMFKGTTRHAPLKFLRTTMRQGGINNASTTTDYTVYWQDVPPGGIHTSIEMEADRMSNLLIKDDLAATEKGVIKEERRKRIDDIPRNALYEEFAKTAYSAHPYGNPVIGTMNDIDSIQAKDLRAHYRRSYSPDNAFIVVAGDVDRRAVTRDIEKHFGPIRAAGKRPNHTQPEPPQLFERTTTLEKEAELPSLLIGYHAPSMPHDESYALQVLVAVLSQGKSSRLHRSLVHQKKLALEAGAEYNPAAVDSTMITIWATPLRDTGTIELKHAIYAEVEALKENPPTPRELRKAKNQLTASFLFSQDSPHSEAAQIALFEMAGGWQLMSTYADNINAVTANQVQTLAAKYLTPANRTVATLRPKKRQKP